MVCADADDATAARVTEVENFMLGMRERSLDCVYTDVEPGPTPYKHIPHAIHRARPKPKVVKYTRYPMPIQE